MAERTDTAARYVHELFQTRPIGFAFLQPADGYVVAADIASAYNFLSEAALEVSGHNENENDRIVHPLPGVDPGTIERSPADG